MFIIRSPRPLRRPPRRQAARAARHSPDRVPRSQAMNRLIPPPPAPRGNGHAPAMALARDAFGREIVAPGQPQEQPLFGEEAPQQPAAPKEKATDALGRR